MKNLYLCNYKDISYFSSLTMSTDKNLTQLICSDFLRIAFSKLLPSNYTLRNHIKEPQHPAAMRLR